MRDSSLGEFEELILLMVAAQHDEAYGVGILEALEEKLDRKNKNQCRSCYPQANGRQRIRCFSFWGHHFPTRRTS